MCTCASIDLCAFPGLCLLNRGYFVCVCVRHALFLQGDKEKNKAWQLRHHPSINQLCSVYMRAESTCTYKGTNQESAEICWLNVMSFIIQYRAEREEREIARNGLGVGELNMTPRRLCLKVRWRRGSAPSAKPFRPSFLFIWSPLEVCRMSHQILLRIWDTSWGDGCAGTCGWRRRRNRVSWQVKKLYL